MLADIIIPTVVFLLLGGVMGTALYIASKVFTVKTDDRTVKITEVLPGANCGGCGYAGCAALADAIVKGEASISACPVGGRNSAILISNIMGTSSGDVSIDMKARVMCLGTTEYAEKKYIYKGVSDCVAAAGIGGGDKLCPNGCIGLGTCVKKCPFDAISIIDGVAVINEKKCTGCGECIVSCPKNLIRLVKADSVYFVGCMSHDTGKVTGKYCDIGCIGCRICEKNCEADAVRVTDFLAAIDYDKCIGCGVCTEKCPRNIIKSTVK